MQIGDCWFDLTRGELTNKTTEKVWHLPRAELQVLTLLVQNKGSLVPKKSLKEASVEHAPLSDSSVARAVFMVRSFLGPQHEYLIETVKGKGYLLLCEDYQHQEQDPIDKAELDKDSNKSIATNGQRNSPMVVSAVLALLVFVASVGYYFSLKTPTLERTEAFHDEVITLLSGQEIGFHLYAASNTNNRLLMEQASEVYDSLSLCDKSQWKQVYISLSHDNQVFNMTLRGESLGQSVVRNLKISDTRSRNLKSFVTINWLQEVGICES